MINLLETMHKCCLPSGVPSESPSAYEKSLVHKIFGGLLRSQVTFSSLANFADWNYFPLKKNAELGVLLEILWIKILLRFRRGSTFYKMSSSKKMLFKRSDLGTSCYVIHCR